MEETLLELLTRQEEEIRMWVDDNPDATAHEFNIANNIVVSLSVNIDCLPE